MGDNFIIIKNQTQELINNYEVSKNVIQYIDEDVPLDNLSNFSKDID